ncbi:nuclease domain-containing protein [Citrobacter freundii]|uniref:nuclease domain-containing protein n=1 Tax=Citrobacter freundii TaxID=546 RepID=UPI0021AFEB98|nr:nuclease domain-containing protein [Citrobacter freundii]MCT4726243.1 EstP [Citrobacter freundii]MCT4751457.1 EstP [Citrobacter freundii]MDT7166965.1 nuclease domain-containing protein [Citrobacter freundii]MDT7207687.1 nuclease domain-containing protein [Citrobacter freundii]MDT7237401.1 nuclease domain-containing protein [Citrobacter freundii]
MWRSEARRTAGQITFVIGNSTLKLDIDISEQTKSDLSRYLSDFKADLWELILDENSHITGDAKNSQVAAIDQEALSLVASILSNAQTILKKPKVELKEIQALKPAKEVRPVPRTFMEICTKGSRKHLTSRASEPSYNVPENQYVLYVVLSTLSIVKQLVKVAESKKSRFSGAIEKLNERLDSLKDYRIINRDLVVKDLERLKKRFDTEVINAELASQLGEINANKYFSQNHAAKGYLRLEKTTGSENEWWAKIKPSQHDDWQQFELDGYTIFSSGEYYASLFQPYSDYDMVAIMPPPSRRGTASILYPEYISKLTILADSRSLLRDKEKFSKLREQGIALNENGWKTKLTPEELSEQEKERETIRKRLSYFASEHEKVGIVHQVLAPKIKPFQQVEKEWRQCKVKSKSTFPNSMTFVQNPAYQAVHSGFKKLKEQIGLADEDILLSLEKIEAIGLVNMPLIYERWCLLQIIKVLTQAFRYLPEDNWKRKLIANIQGNEEQISIQFFNPNVSRKVTLQYEPFLANGKRPDFVLDVEAITKSGNQISKRLVVDAKYYSAAYLKLRGGIGGVIHELYNGKDYSECQENSVFVLHPVLDAVEKVVSPQEWAKDSYLGELSMFDWEPAYHQRQATNYGAVCANPMKSQRYLDEIQRMLGMFLQYGIEDNTSFRGASDDTHAVNFCVSCGSEKVVDVTKSMSSNNQKRWYRCNECTHFTVYTHCGTCNTRLIKNGEYWTYLSLMPMSSINIKCPNCESPV